MKKGNLYNLASSQIPVDSVDQSHSPSWLEWCSDPRIEGGILAVSMFVALVSWGLVGR
jgi:hypothetical protein